MTDLLEISVELNRAGWGLRYMVMEPGDSLDALGDLAEKRRRVGGTASLRGPDANQTGDNGEAVGNSMIGFGRHGPVRKYLRLVNRLIDSATEFIL